MLAEQAARQFVYPVVLVTKVMVVSALGVSKIYPGQITEETLAYHS